MIDASFTLAPRQRNTREENKSIKNGEGNNLWNDKPNKRNTKTLMLVGQRKMERLSKAIKIT
ncbi:MAG: IS5 family transposase [Glaciecola sp.]|jgi:IS5 family transposase